LIKKRELALLKQMPWARGADGVEGAGSAPPQHFLHSLRADRNLERKERELPRAFAWASVHAVVLRWQGCLRVLQISLPTRWRVRGGSREQNEWAVELPFPFVAEGTMESLWHVHAFDYFD
jgi:hypothetical protein